MKKLATMREALARPELLGDALPGPSWHAWRVLLIALCGESLHPSEREVFARLTGGREREPLALVDAFLAVAGRRSGKSRAMAVLVVYLATLCTWDDCLSLGERGLALFMAPTEEQAAVAFRYACALVEGSPVLSALVVKRIADTLELSNRVDLQVIPASWRRSRGRTAIAICLDECAFLATADDSLNRDAEIVVALRPSLATTGGPMLLTSSPSTFEGIVAKIFKRHHGPAGDARVVVVQSDTAGLNPSLSQAVIDRAFEDDPEAAGSEWGGAFRAPVSAFLARSVVDKAVDVGVRERCCLPGVQYFAAVDVAGGTGADSFTAAIGHKQRDAGRDVCVVDLIFEQKPVFDPDETTNRLCAILRPWGVRSVTGDHYASAWPISSFARCGISYSHAPLTTSEVYLHTVPLWTAGRVSLVDNQRLVDQLCGLRRKVGSAGREQVTHMGGAHDDLATAVCGLLWKLSPAKPRLECSLQPDAGGTTSTGMRQEVDIRYVVTSLKGSAQHLYENVYCQRGQMENLIKLHKAQLASDRMSCHSAIANQVRLVFHIAAYWLMHRVRAAIPPAHPLARAEFATIRERLIKIAARVIEHVARIRIQLPTSCPEGALFRTVALGLMRSGP